VVCLATGEEAWLRDGSDGEEGRLILGEAAEQGSSLPNRRWRADECFVSLSRTRPTRREEAWWTGPGPS
jgi:hypothetical protein